MERSNNLKVATFGMRWMEILSICQEGNIVVLPIRQCRKRSLGFLSLAPMNFSSTHCFSILQVFLASATAGSTVPPLNGQ